MGLSTEDMNLKYPKLKIYPFDYHRKLFPSTHKYNNNRTKIFTKGAVESILSK